MTQPVGDIEGVDHLQRSEHDRQCLLGCYDLGPGQPRAAVDQADDKGGAGGWHQEDVARQLVQIDMAQLAELVLDDATFRFAHGRRTTAQVMAFEHPVDGRG